MVNKTIVSKPYMKVVFGEELTKEVPSEGLTKGLSVNDKWKQFLTKCVNERSF